MENILMISQIVFYILASFAILVLGTLCIILLYRVNRITKEVKGLVRDLKDVSYEAQERIKMISERLSILPFLSALFKPKKSHKKGVK